MNVTEFLNKFSALRSKKFNYTSTICVGLFIIIATYSIDSNLISIAEKGHPAAVIPSSPASTRLVSQTNSSKPIDKLVPSTNLRRVRRSSPNDTLLVHYVRLYEVNPETHGFHNLTQLCFLECLSVLSVMTLMKNAKIFIHSNFPSYIPYEACRNLSDNVNWDDIKMMEKPLYDNAGGVPIEWTHHAADLAKLEIVHEYGGIAIDFDVYLLKGKKIRSILAKYECIISQEFVNPPALNAGFLACRKGSAWPLALLSAYQTDFRPKEFLYNSARLPYIIYSNGKHFRDTLFVDQTIANNPNGNTKYLMQQRNNVIDWKAKLGYHSFLGDCDFDMNALQKNKWSFGHLLRYVLEMSKKLKKKI